MDLMQQAQLFDIDGTPISPVTSTETVFIDENTTVKETMTDNGQKFRFGYLDGKFGYYTDDERGADSFSPFSKGKDIGILKDIDAITFVGQRYYISTSCTYENKIIKMFFQSSTFDANFGVAVYRTPKFDFTNKTKLKVHGYVSFSTNFTEFVTIGYGSDVAVGTGAYNEMVLTDGDEHHMSASYDLMEINDEFDISSANGEKYICFSAYARGYGGSSLFMIIDSIILE